MKCAKCQCLVADGKDLFGYCQACIFAMGESQKHLTREDRNRLKAYVDQETAGLIPAEALKLILEEAYDKLSKATDPFDIVIDDTANEIQRLAGLGMCRHILQVIEGLEKASSSLGDLAREQSEEIKRKVRVLSNLPRGGKV